MFTDGLEVGPKALGDEMPSSRPAKLIPSSTLCRLLAGSCAVRSMTIWCEAALRGCEKDKDGPRLVAPDMVELTVRSGGRLELTDG